MEVVEGRHKLSKIITLLPKTPLGVEGLGVRAKGGPEVVGGEVDIRPVVVVVIIIVITTATLVELMY